MQFYKISFLLLLGLAMSNMAFSQATTTENSWSAQFNVQHHDLGGSINFGLLGVVNEVKIRPYYTLEGQYAMQRKPNKKRIFSGQLGYYQDLYHERWITAKLGLGTEWSLVKGFYLGMRAEFGLAGIKNADLQYEYDGEKWVVADNTAPYRIGLILNPRLDLGYRMIQGAHPIDIVITGQTSLVGSEIGILPYVAYGLGVRYGL